MPDFEQTVVNASFGVIAERLPDEYELLISVDKEAISVSLFCHVNGSPEHIEFKVEGETVHEGIQSAIRYAILHANDELDTEGQRVQL